MQYRQFRQGLIPLIIVSLVYLIGRRLFDWATSRFDSTQTTSTRKLHYYVLPFALVFVFALHGLSALKVLFLIWVNYRLAQSFAGRPIWGQAICWSFNVGILICNKHFDGYQTLKLLPLLRPLVRPGSYSFS